MSVLRLRDVAFAYPGFAPVVQAIALDVPAGSVHCLLGRSGCGKTTVLKLAAGLLAPTQGQVTWRGAAEGDTRQVGFVFQSPTLLDWLTVLDNVLLPVSLQRKPTRADE